jgi:hypothetical protein
MTKFLVQMCEVEMRLIKLNWASDHNQYFLDQSKIAEFEVAQSEEGISTGGSEAILVPSSDVSTAVPTRHTLIQRP